MARTGTICIIDDNRSILKTLEILLSEHFQKVITLASPQQINSVFKSEKIDVALLDMNFSAGINSGNEGLFWMSEIKKISPASQVVLFTAYAYIDLAVSGIKAGAFDFITKPWDNEKLIETLKNALANSCSEKKKPKKQTSSDNYFRGESDSMKRLYTQMERVAVTDANILITGENGTGKEVIAQQIHGMSKRKELDMITVDMGALTESLFESELFGHVKGAFTDAKSDRPGKFETASGSTLFLDEIGNLPYHLQSKLLTVLQKRQVVKVGSNTPVDVNIRLICATNCNLAEMVRKGTFREDLYYRINTISLELPALRDRRDDIIPLSEMFMNKYASLYDKTSMNMNDNARNKLMSYKWPGNVRELQHTIEKAVIMGDKVLDEYDFHFNEPASGFDDAQNMTLEEMEKIAIRNAITSSEGNMSMVAQQLGITRQTLYNKIKKYNIL